MLILQDLLKNQAIRFILIGIINTLFGYGLFSLFIFLRFNSSMAIFLSTLVGIVLNFNTLGHFVFNNTDKKLLIKFISSYLFLMLFNMTLEKSLHFIVSSNYFSGLLSIIITAGLSYAINKNLVFK